MPPSKIGSIFVSVQNVGSKAKLQTSSWARNKKENSLSWAKLKKDRFLSLPLVSLVDNKVHYLLSQDNIDNMQMKYYEYYHWLAGTEVTEVQERARYLESRLNMNRKEMRENRELLDNITERLRSITSELEHTGRGDLKHLHLRQLEYDTIQEELKLSRMVQKSEFQERETFTLLMNAVRESHETERNYNQRIKMISLLGAILGPFIGYIFSARLNKMRFKRMEEVIDSKLNLLSLSTICAIKEIHGLDPDIMTEPEKIGFIKRIRGMAEAIKISLIQAFNSLKDSYAIDDSQVLSLEQSPIVKSPKVEMKDASVQAVYEPVKTEPKLVVPRLVDKISIPDLKSVLVSLKSIEDKQDSLQTKILDYQELQEANKIEVSVNTSDDEIIKMLQSDQANTKRNLLSIQDNLKILQLSVNKSLKDVQSNIDNLSMKITNSSELYIGNLEHSQILNDLSKLLTNIKGNLESIETVYSDDTTKQLEELKSIHNDLTLQRNEVDKNNQLQQERFAQIDQKLVENGVNSSEVKSKIEAMAEMLHSLNNKNSTEDILLIVEQLTEGFEEIRLAIVSDKENNNQLVKNSVQTLENSISGDMMKMDEKFGRQQKDIYSSLLGKLDEISKTPPETFLQGHECRNKSVTEDLAKLGENITQRNDHVYCSILEKLEELSKPPMHTLHATKSCQTDESDFALPKEIDACSATVSSTVESECDSEPDNTVLDSVDDSSNSVNETAAEVIDDVPVKSDSDSRRHPIVYVYSAYVVLSIAIAYNVFR